jgi:hypothetical protein
MVLPEIVGVLVPGVAAELLEGVVALQCTYNWGLGLRRNGHVGPERCYGLYNGQFVLVGFLVVS